MSLPGTFSFSQNDMTEFFKLYGKIERIVLKQCSSKSTADEAAKIKDGEAIAYVIYADYCSAVLALKVLNSAPEKEKIITARICQTNLLTSEGQLFSEPLIDASMVKDMVIEVERVLL